MQKKGDKAGGGSEVRIIDDVALLERDYGRQGFFLSPEPYSNADPTHGMELTRIHTRKDALRIG